jgi:hypothetical protein
MSVFGRHGSDTPKKVPVSAVEVAHHVLVVAQVPDEIADQLYAVPPEEFVAARDAAAETVRAAGDRDQATAISKLRKPTVAAWLVNLLALRRPELVAELVDLAGKLRTAQRELRGDELRDLSSRRRAAIAGLVGQARALAVVAQPGLAGVKLPVADVETTLTAALADEEIAAQVRSGRLVRTIAYTGFGEVPRPRLRLVAEPDDTPPATAGSTGTGTFSGDGQMGTGKEDAGKQTAGKAAAKDGSGKAAAAADSAAADSPAADSAAAPKEDAGRARGRAGEPGVPAASPEHGRGAGRIRRPEVERLLADARTAQQAAQEELERSAVAEREGVHSLAAADAAVVEAQRGRVAAEAELSRRKLAHKAAQRAVSAARRRLGDAQAALESITGYQDPTERTGGQSRADNYADQPNGRRRRSAG